jgi:hypothetical protein
MIYVKGHVGINYHSSYDNVMSNTNFILYIPWKGTFQIYVHAIVRFYLWDFYFRALRSLVVLSFPQLLSFSSVFPKPLSETLKELGREDSR